MKALAIILTRQRRVGEKEKGGGGSGKAKTKLCLQITLIYNRSFLIDVHERLGIFVANEVSSGKNG
jgi:hypothetical protein